MISNVNVRKLEKNEHIRTRRLWEEIFTEDSAAFLDYYYSVKTEENEIYVIEDEGNIISMLHLNPYQMRIGQKVYSTNYIVAVATAEAYRRQGLMARLMHHVLAVMKERGEPFTFLMPADEAIYKPFGFSFVYQQSVGKLRGSKVEDSIDFQHATTEDCQAIADFANGLLKEFDVVTWRTADYYQTILAEQTSEQGGVLIARKLNEIVGVFCYAREGRVEIREPLFQEEAILRQAICVLTGSESEEVVCIGYGEKTKPMIMAKVLQSEFETCFENAKVFLNEVV